MEIMKSGFDKQERQKKFCMIYNHFNIVIIRDLRKEETSCEEQQRYKL